MQFLLRLVACSEGCDSTFAIMLIMSSILFVCTGNLYRSPMAAAFFKRKLGESGQTHGWVVGSAGTWTESGQPVPQKVLLVASQMSINLSNHETQQIDRDLLIQHDLVVVMEKGHKEALGIEFPFVSNKLHLLSELGDQLSYDIPDPVHSNQEFSEIAVQISRLIDRSFHRICLLIEQYSM